MSLSHIMKRSTLKNALLSVDDNDAPLKRICEELETAEKQISEAENMLVKARAARENALFELMEAVDAKNHALEEDRKAFELSTQRVAESALPERIKLDVGGRSFSVTLEMMQRFPNSYFARLVSGRWSEKKTEDGAFFINRSARMFEYIVDFLRDGELTVSLSAEDRDALYKETDYYQLDMTTTTTTTTTLQKAEKEVWEWTPAIGFYNKSNGTFTYSQGTIGWNKGVHEWVLRIDGAHDMRIGICPEKLPIDYSDCYRLDSDGDVWKPTGCGACAMGVTSKFRVGSLVSVRLDMDQLKLTFGVDGRMGNPISIGSGMWYPCVGIGKQSSVTTIM